MPEADFVVSKVRAAQERPAGEKFRLPVLLALVNRLLHALVQLLFRLIREPADKVIRAESRKEVFQKDIVLPKGRSLCVNEPDFPRPTDIPVSA